MYYYDCNEKVIVSFLVNFRTASSLILAYSIELRLIVCHSICQHAYFNEKDEGYGTAL